ncbi:hypothetical protein LCGC14_2354260, partial [marine sediment metagenome]
FPDNHPYAKDHGGLLAVWTYNLDEVGISVPGDVEPLIGDSAQHGKEWAEGPIHLLFIDAGHSYGEVMRDIDAWAPHIAPEGVIVFHDYWRNATHHALCQSVKQAVNDWHAEAQWSRVDGPDTMIYFIKPIEEPPKWSEIPSRQPSDSTEEFEVFVADDPIIDPAEADLMTARELSAHFYYDLDIVRKYVKKLESNFAALIKGNE